MDAGAHDYTPYQSTSSSRRADLMHRMSSSSSRSQPGEIEQVVTKLLRTTKSLLEALTQWSQLRASTADILDYRETLERQFHSVTQAFEDSGVPMSDLAWIPQQLRESISGAMKEEPSPATLDQHLPRIRDVIVHLLHGLKGKQQLLREKDAAAQHQSWSHRSSTDSWRREVPAAALARGAGLSSGSSSRPLHPPDRSPPPGATRLTSSDYDPRSGSMPRPSVSSESAPRAKHDYYSSSHHHQQQQQRSYSPTYGQQHMPSPSRTSSTGLEGRPPSTTSSTSSSRGYLARGSPPPPPPPPPPPASSPLPASTYLTPRSAAAAGDLDENDPNTAHALAALKRQENLARRSSVRRASMFRSNGLGDYHPMKRQGVNEVIPPVPSLPANAAALEGKKAKSSSDVSDEPGMPSVPESETNEKGEDGKEKGLTLYLQIGKDVKKVYYTGEMSIPALRMLFIERFGYSSGLNDFPSIYIRDPTVQVSYELENLDEVVDKTVLSLNVNDKDLMEQAQKKWMQEISATVEKEVGEIRRLLTEQVEDIKKQLQEVQTTTVPVSAPVPPPPPPAPPAAPVQETSDVAARETVVGDKTSKASSFGNLSVGQIQGHLREIEKLRRDMAVVRQLQKEMREGTDSVVSELKEKAQQLRLQEKEDAGKQVSQSAARQFIEEGKEKLLSSSDKITARLEDLQDTVDQLKLDVTQRKCRPSEAQMAHCRKEKKVVAEEIKEFGDYIVKVKPKWKKTWEQELQTIVKEQQMLKEQEGLLLDMQDDLTALVEVFEQIEKICAYQAKAKPVVREFHVAPAEEGFEGMTSVLKQVATIDVDHERRLRALDQAEKMRQRELDNRIDEFERELTSFVDAKKLKKTGGAEEADRLRRQKDEDILRQIYLQQKEKEKQESNSEEHEEAS